MTSWWTDAIDSGDVDALAELISSGADLHAQDEEGNTALHAAAQGELACAAKLLELGANVNAQNGVGTTALIEAVKYGDCEQVKALLAAGADAALADDEGDAHAHAAAGGDAEIVAALKGEEVAAPASPTGPATKKGRRNSVSSESVDPNQKVDLLMKAVEYEDIEVVRIFLAAGASLDAANNDGATAVEMAKGLADPEIYGLLTGTKVEHKEREAPAGGDGEEPKRRNSVSQQNLADFTDAFQDANRASAEEF